MKALAEEVQQQLQPSLSLFGSGVRRSRNQRYMAKAEAVQHRFRPSGIVCSSRGEKFMCGTRQSIGVSESCVKHRQPGTIVCCGMHVATLCSETHLPRLGYSDLSGTQLLLQRSAGVHKIHLRAQAKVSGVVRAIQPVRRYASADHLRVRRKRALTQLRRWGNVALVRAAAW